MLHIQINFRSYFRPMPVPRPVSQIQRPGPQVPQPTYHQLPQRVAEDETLVRRVEQFITLATAFDCVVIQSSQANRFLAVSPAAMIVGEGPLSAKLQLKIHQTFDVIETDATQSPGGDITVDWLDPAVFRHLPQNIGSSVRAELRFSICPGCGHRLSEDEHFHWCPFCGHRLIAEGQSGAELRACVRCAAEESEPTTWIYHSTCRFCAHCGERLKIWRSHMDDDVDYDKPTLIAGVKLEDIEDCSPRPVRAVPIEHVFEDDILEAERPAAIKPTGKARKQKHNLDAEPQIG
jgi:hypothetical protein